VTIREALEWFAATMDAVVARIPEWSAWWLLVPAAIVALIVAAIVWFITRPLDYY
jgi:hypothetical protein